MRLGQWESRRLDRLDRLPGFDPLAIVEDYSRSDYSAINRAAHRLARKGLVDLHRVWRTDARGRRSAYLWLFRPGLTPAAVGLEAAITAYERGRVQPDAGRGSTPAATTAGRVQP